MPSKNKLKELRSSKNTTQKELAEFLNITAATYSRYENGVHQPDNETLLKLAKYFDVSVDYLLGNDIKRNRSTAAYDFEGNVKKLDDNVQMVFNDLSGLDEDDFEQFKQFYEFIKSKKK